MTKNCLKCSIEFQTKYHTQKYCCRKCSLEVSNEKYRKKTESELLKKGFFCWSAYKERNIIM